MFEVRSSGIRPYLIAPFAGLHAPVALISWILVAASEWFLLVGVIWIVGIEWRASRLRLRADASGITVVNYFRRYEIHWRDVRGLVVLFLAAALTGACNGKDELESATVTVPLAGGDVESTYSTLHAAGLGVSIPEPFGLSALVGQQVAGGIPSSTRSRSEGNGRRPSPNVPRPDRKPRRSLA
jgi:hypothetical protein